MITSVLYGAAINFIGRGGLVKGNLVKKEISEKRNCTFDIITFAIKKPLVIAVVICKEKKKAKHS